MPGHGANGPPSRLQTCELLGSSVLSKANVAVGDGLGLGGTFVKVGLAGGTAYATAAPCKS